MNVEVGRRAVAAEARCEFADALIAGLSARQKSIPCRFFYDAEGSALFEAITELPEYYPTRTETAILRDHAADMAALAAPGAVLIEFGSGSSTKTELLLAEMRDLHAYVPIDISGSALREAQARIKARFANLAVLPVEGDFSQPLALGDNIASRPRLGFFPGSTIGNFVPRSATDLLRQFRALLGPGAKLLIGMDRVKPVERLLTAYDDPEGITAEFNLNLIARINRELDGDIPVDAFRHETRWNDILSRIEMHLVATRDVAFTISGETFRFAESSSIHTENSHKYADRAGRLLLLAGGWTPHAEWTDPSGDFSIVLAEAEPERFAP
jgi:L-histidine Nalpha-methyltransferase